MPGILVHGAQDVLGVLLRLVFVEQRHDLPHHLVHGIVAHFLRDGDELDAVLRQLPDIELHFEVIAEEVAERVDDEDIKGCGLGRHVRARNLNLRELDKISPDQQILAAGFETVAGVPGGVTRKRNRRHAGKHLAGIEGAQRLAIAVERLACREEVATGTLGARLRLPSSSQNTTSRWWATSSAFGKTASPDAFITPPT